MRAGLTLGRCHLALIDREAEVPALLQRCIKSTAAARVIESIDHRQTRILIGSDVEIVRGLAAFVPGILGDNLAGGGGRFLSLATRTPQP